VPQGTFNAVINAILHLSTACRCHEVMTGIQAKMTAQAVWNIPSIKMTGLLNIIEKCDDLH